MTSAMRKANIRAAFWATAISGTGLVAELLTRHLLFHDGEIRGFDVRAMILGQVGWICLLPGHLFALLMRVVIQALTHPVATWHIITAHHEGENGFFIAEFNFGIGIFFPALVTWMFYFLVARSYFRSGNQRLESRV